MPYPLCLPLRCLPAPTTPDYSVCNPIHSHWKQLLSRDWSYLSTSYINFWKAFLMHRNHLLCHYACKITVHSLYSPQCCAKPQRRDCNDMSMTSCFNNCKYLCSLPELLSMSVQFLEGSIGFCSIQNLLRLFTNMGKCVVLFLRQQQELYTQSGSAICNQVVIYVFCNCIIVLFSMCLFAFKLI